MAKPMAESIAEETKRLDISISRLKSERVKFEAEHAQLRAEKRLLSIEAFRRERACWWDPNVFTSAAVMATASITVSLNRFT